jgi:hypothetical protein
MAQKRCDQCGCFVHLTDLMPQDDQFDEELAIECGFNPDSDDEYSEKWEQFHYVQDQWECNNCGCTAWYTEGERYYFDPEECNYSAEAKPLTPKAQAAQERKRQEEAGQQRMF